MEFNSPMAKQFNGPVIDSLLNARHNIFNESEEFMLHRQGLTLETATTTELDLIGKFLCIPRPYAMVDGEPEYCDDTFYRIYIQNLAILRQSQSIYDLARMFDQFMPDGRYFVSFQPNGDLLVVLDEQYISYTPFFQKALDSVFTALPRINALTSWDFDKFVYDHRLYTRLISLVNSDWEFDIEQFTGALYLRQTEFPWISVLSTICQLSNGDILVGVSDISSEYVGLWKSTDNGATFVHQDTLPSGFGVTHIVQAVGYIFIAGKYLDNITSEVYYSTAYYSVDQGITYTEYSYSTLPYARSLQVYGVYNSTWNNSVATAFNFTGIYIDWLFLNEHQELTKMSIADSYWSNPSMYPYVLAEKFDSANNSWLCFLGRRTLGLELIDLSLGARTIGNFSGLYICLVRLTSSGRLWVSCTTSQKLYYSDDYENFQEKIEDTCYFMLEDSQGRLWTGGEEGKLYCSTDEGETFNVAFESSDLPSGTHIVLQDMIELSDGSFYLYGTTDTNGSMVLYRVFMDVSYSRATVISPSGNLTVTNHIATATIERRT